MRSSATSTMANIASLIFEAKVDVFKFKGFAGYAWPRIRTMRIISRAQRNERH